MGAELLSGLLCFGLILNQGAHALYGSIYNHLMTKLTVLPNSYLTLNYRLTLPSGEDYINTFIDRLRR